MLRPLVRATTRRVWTGVEHVPSEGGAVLAPNHLSFADPLLIAYFVDENGRAPRFLAKAELFEVPVFGRILRDAGQIPVRRHSSAAARAYESAVAAIRRGECVVVYPEGTLTHDPQLWPMRARTGIARIALATGAPVIPIAQWGVQRILPPWSKRLRLVPRHRVDVSVGPPVELSDLYDREVTADLLAEATERIMDAITAQLEVLRGESAPAIRVDPGRMARPARTDRSAVRDERQPGPMSTDRAPEDDR